MLISNPQPRCRRRILGVVAFKPVVDVEEVDLLCPKQPCECLSLHALFVFRGLGRLDRGVELISFRPAPRDDLVDVFEGGFDWLGREPQPQDNRAARGNGVLVVQAGLGSAQVWIDCAPARR